MALVIGMQIKGSVTIFSSDGPITITRLPHEGKMRLAIDAPKHIKILRNEILTPEEKERLSCPNPSNSGSSPSLITKPMLKPVRPALPLVKRANGSFGLER
jgi:sRNA-binding carbon storage regulator CsrA